MASLLDFLRSLRPVRWAPLPALAALVAVWALHGPIAGIGAGVATVVLAHLAVGLWRPVLVAPFAEADAELAAAGPQTGFDRKTAVIFITAAVCVTLLEYVGMSNRHFVVTDLMRLVGLGRLGDALDASMGEQINRLTWWAGWCVTTYFVIPALVIRLVLRERIRDYGFRLKGALEDAWVYGLFLCVMLPIVAYVSQDLHFQRTYPFYDMSPGEGVSANLVRWEILYALQFLTLEFFFRGFLVHGTKHRLGAMSVFAMMVPYCMIHFGKPLPETVGAIIAGIVLGALSLRTRSIWLGVMIHVTIAWSMDGAVLWRTGVFG